MGYKIFLGKEGCGCNGGSPKILDSNGFFIREGGGYFCSWTDCTKSEGEGRGLEIILFRERSGGRVYSCGSKTSDHSHGKRLVCNKFHSLEIENLHYNSH